MKQLYTILTILVTITVHGQSQKSQLKLTKDSDTAFWKSYQMKVIEDFNLPNLNTESEFVFRSWNPGSFVEISKNQDSIEARVVYFVYEVWENDYRADKFVKEYQLPNSTSTRLYNFVSNSGVQKIPSDKYIEAWKQGFDGITYIYELKENNEYSFKNFWTPKSQNELEEAKFIIEFNKNIFEIGDLEKYDKKFEKDIPFLHYKYSGTAYYVIKNYTRKEWRKYKRKKMKKKKTRDTLL